MAPTEPSNPGIADLLRRFVRNDIVTSLAILTVAIFAAGAIFAEAIATHDPFESTDDTFRPPTSQHIFGTDDLGRDIFSGIIHGSRTSIVVGISVSLIAGLIGVFVGAVAGMLGGNIDDLLMRFTELGLIPPRFFLALVIVALFGSSTINLIVILALTYWTTTTRLVRSEVMSLKERPFVEASRAMGASDLRILFREIIPNAMPVIVTNVTLMIGNVILLEAALDFIGISDPNRISWGAMLHNGQHFTRDGWWMVVFPCLALSALVLSLNILADALNRWLDPKSRGVHLNRSV